MAARKCPRDVAATRWGASFYGFKAWEGRRTYEDGDDDEEDRFRECIRSVSSDENIVAKTEQGAHRRSIHPAIRDFGELGCLVADFLKELEEGLAENRREDWSRTGRGPVRGQRNERNIPSRKTHARGKGRGPPRCFWGVEVVKNVIKMCLELPREKDVMNIKRALEARAWRHYPYRYTSRSASNREIDSPQKQADSLERAERSRLWRRARRAF